MIEQYTNVMVAQRWNKTLVMVAQRWNKTLVMEKMMWPDLKDIYRKQQVGKEKTDTLKFCSINVYNIVLFGLPGRRARRLKNMDCLYHGYL